MPTKRKRSGRGATLSIHDQAALTVGCGVNNWTAAERARLLELWQQHGERIVREAAQRDAPEPWGVLEFGQPI